jgi:probable DNA metabolism protein
MGGVYRYDGSFAGLLTLLARLLPKRILPDAIGSDPPPQQNLFAGVATVETDQELVEEFLAELTKRLTPSSLHLVRLAFLADRPERELLICRYCLLAWEVGRKAGSMLAHPHVAPLWKLGRQVGREAHRYLGFVRFKEVTGGFYYAAIAPDHRILSLIAPHFAARFSDQQWVIHDLNHGEGLVHDRQRREWLLLPMESSGEPDLTPAEERFQELWRSYFTTLAIAERENLRLQQSKVPLKVRPWLVEFARSSSCLLS